MVVVVVVAAAVVAVKVGQGGERAVVAVGGNAGDYM
jgi:hypothetical protein